MDNALDIFAPLTRAEIANGTRQNAEPPCEAKPICPPADAESGASAAARLYGRKPDCFWRYATADDETAFYAARWNELDGKKAFRPVSWRQADGWQLLAWPDHRPLYNLPALAGHPTAPVVVCEGEKATDAAVAIFPDSVLTTSSGGAGAAAKTDWTPLAGRTVLIWPDYDVAGEKYASEVAPKLATLDCSISIVDAKALASIDPSGGSREPIEKWDAADAAAEWRDLAALRETATRLLKPFDPGPAFLSYGPYEMTGEGLCVEIEKGRAKSKESVSIAAPFEILGACRDPHGRGWGKWLRWRDGDRRVHVQHVTDAALQGDPAPLCASLASDGLRINRSQQRAFVNYLSGASVKGRVTIVMRTGWHDINGQSVFVLPETTIGPRGSETVILDAAANGPYEASGSLEDWQAGVGTLVSGHGLPILAISAALAGPLLHLAGQEGGGVHFFGQSSKGKTTILQAAASVWGRGALPGYVRAWRATANGLEGAAALSTDTALVLDELGVLDARDAGAAIYSLANGGGKQRATRDGSLRDPKSWRVIFVSSGEVPFEAKLTEGKSKARAGQLLRLLDVPADRGLGFGVFNCGGSQGDAGALARAIKVGASNAFGTAGPEFVRRIFADSVDGEDVRAMIAAFVKTECPPRADGQLERVAHRFGLIGVAGEIAIGTGVAPWLAGEALNAAAWAFKAWLSNRGGAGPAEARQAIEQVRLYMEQHGDSRFDPLDIEAKPSPNRAGWRKGDGEECEWFIPPETWKFEICAGLDAAFVARTLAELGIIERANDGFQPVRRIGGSSKRVYVMNARIFAGGDHVA